MRFDCDLSRDVDDPGMKKHSNYYKPEHYYAHELTGEQRERVLQATEKWKAGRAGADR